MIGVVSSSTVAVSEAKCQRFLLTKNTQGKLHTKKQTNAEQAKFLLSNNVVPQKQTYELYLPYNRLKPLPKWTT